MAGRSHSKDDKESVRELGICGTTEQSTMKPSSEGIPDQMMDFFISNGKFVKGVRPMIARYIHCWIC